MTVLRICWRSFSEYFGTKEKIVKESGGAKSSGRTEVLEAETSFLEPMRKVKILFIFSELS